MSLTDQIHARALELSRRYLETEASLIEVLQDVEAHRVHIKQGQPSVFQYVVRVLGLSESVAYNLITVSRKAREVPELKSAIEQGAITLSNARKIVPVLDARNQEHWLKKASELSHRELEKEVAKVRPETSTPEKATYVSGERVRLELGLAEEAMLSLRRAQDLLSQKMGRAVSLEETIRAMTGDFLKRHDPVEKAKRQEVKKGIQSQPATLRTEVPEPVTLQARTPIPAAVRHEVHLRDQGQCTRMSQGVRCTQKRWIHLHHLIPVSKRGPNTAENLITLCAAHHEQAHRPLE